MVKKSHKRHKHKKHNYTKKRKSYNKNKKGGNGSNIINPANLQSTPNQVYSFPAGSTSAANAAQNYLNTMSQKQTELNHNLHNGGGGKKKQRGGVADITADSGAGASATGAGAVSASTASGAPPGDYYSCTAQNPNFTTVAQFSSSGPDVSPLNANNSSITTNVTSITGKNNALNDCYASGTCQEVDCPAGEAVAAADAEAAAEPTQSGGRGSKKRRKGKKSRRTKSKRTKRI